MNHKFEVFLIIMLILLFTIRYIDNTNDTKIETINSDFLCYNTVTDKQINCTVEKIDWMDGNVTFSINITQ